MSVLAFSFFILPQLPHQLAKTPIRLLPVHHPRHCFVGADVAVTVVDRRLNVERGEEIAQLRRAREIERSGAEGLQVARDLRDHAGAEGVARPDQVDRLAGHEARLHALRPARRAIGLGVHQVGPAAEGDAEKARAAAVFPPPPAKEIERVADRLVVIKGAPGASLIAQSVDDHLGLVGRGEEDIELRQQAAPAGGTRRRSLHFLPQTQENQQDF